MGSRSTGWAIAIGTMLASCDRSSPPDALVDATGGNSATGGRSAGGAGNNGGAMTDGSTLSGGDSGSGADPSGGTASIRLPPPDAPFDYQIGAPYPPPSGVAVVSRDRESAPAPALYNICYVNGLQTQPHEGSWWLETHPELLLRDEGGEPVLDEDWGEILFDTRTDAQRAALAAVVGLWIEACARDGFDAVEIDNLDSYARAGGLLDEDGNVAYMARLSAIAHEAGLAIAQKNAAELLGRAAEMGTDFAIAEECNRWHECAAYQQVYEGHVFVIEYRRQDFDAGCADFPELSIVLRDLQVTGPDSTDYVFDGC